MLISHSNFSYDFQRAPHIFLKEPIGRAFRGHYCKSRKKWEKSRHNQKLWLTHECIVIYRIEIESCQRESEFAPYCRIGITRSGIDIVNVCSSLHHICPITLPRMQGRYFVVSLGIRKRITEIVGMNSDDNWSERSLGRRRSLTRYFNPFSNGEHFRTSSVFLFDSRFKK
jgi:hypothetical protein